MRADRRVIEKRDHQCLVIPLQGHVAAGKRVLQQAVEHAAGIRPAVDIVAERHGEAVAAMLLGVAVNRRDHAVEQIEPAMNIADRVNPHILAWNCCVFHYDRRVAGGRVRRATVYVTPPSKRPAICHRRSPMPATPTQTSGYSPQARIVTALALLWLGGCALRLTILAVPPVIPRIHDDLQLSATQVGILTGLPAMLFAAAAVPGSLLIARLGVRAALIAGLVLAAIGGALRGALPDVLWLYAMTIVMSAGVAIMQVSLPPAVRAWAPDRIGFATAVYTNGLIIGEILPVALMLPLVLPMVGGSWQWGFVVWSVPVVVIAVLALVLAPRQRASGPAPRRHWWPDWRSSLIWKLGIMLGSINAIYFSSNAFLPDYLRSTGQGEWISAALTGLNIGAIAGIVPAARVCRPAGTQGLALCHLRPAVPDRNRRPRVRHRRVGRRRRRAARLFRRLHLDPGLRAAALAQPARRRASRQRRDVHDQL